MIVGDSFVKAGWVHSLIVHIYKHPTGDHWFVLGNGNSTYIVI